MMRSGKLRLAVAFLTLCVLFWSLSSTALARGASEMARKALEKAERKQYEVAEALAHRLRFYDLTEASWAAKHFARLNLKGIFKGRGNGQMAPNATVTRAEVLALAIRLMGLEEEAKIESERDDLSFKFNDTGTWLDSWAKGYISAAVENGLIEDTNKPLNPWSAAKRIWVVETLVKAMGKAAQAEEKMDAVLSFKDVNRIPKDLVGYVAVAIEEGLITGYPDNTFLPDKPVTRAEMAAIADRFDVKFGTFKQQSSSRIHGVIESIDTNARTITLVTETEEENIDGQPSQTSKTIAAAETAVVFLKDKPAEFSELLPGDHVEIYLNELGEAEYIFAKFEKQELKAKVVEVTDTGLKVTVADTDDDTPYVIGEELIFEVPGETLVRFQGEDYVFSDNLIQPGDTVELKLHGTQVIEIIIEEQSELEFTGSVEKIENTPPTTVVYAKVIEIDENNPDFDVTEGSVIPLTVTSETEVRYRGNTVSVEELQVGDTVEVKIQGAHVTKLTIERESKEVEFKATVEQVEGNTITVKPTESKDLALELRQDGTLVLTILPETKVLSGRNEISPQQLKKGDLVEIKIENGNLIQVKLEKGD